MFDTKKDPEKIIEEKELKQVTDISLIENIVKGGNVGDFRKMLAIVEFNLSGHNIESKILKGTLAIKIDNNTIASISKLSIDDCLKWFVSEEVLDSLYDTDDTEKGVITVKRHGKQKAKKGIIKADKPEEVSTVSAELYN